MTSAQVPPVPATKQGAPSLRPESIQRRELDSALQAASQQPLAIIRAPAGYGKTTALVHWLEHSGTQHAWLSLDAHDNDPQRFGARLVSAMESVLPDRLDAAERALRGGSGLEATVIPLLAGALAEHAGDRFVIVLDDYQAITHRACHALTLQLVDALPPRACVVVASRTSPTLRLPSRRAAGALGEIGADQLRFGLEESRQVLDGLGLGADQVELIHERVHGWPAGLALTATALTGRRDRDDILQALASSRASLDDYLTEEVLEMTSPQLREFLRRTSILSRLCVPLCEAVLDDPRAGVLLDEVRRTSLFITALDSQGTWFRYHATLAETLSRELELREPQLVGELHRRASEWFEAADMIDEAIDHALLAGDAPRAVTLLAANWGPLVADRRYATMRRILDRLPDEMGELGPLCEALDIDCSIYEGVDQRISAERAQRLFDEHFDDDRVRSVLEGVLISPFYGDVGRALELGRAAWERHASEPDVQAELTLVLAVLLWFAGEYDEVRALLEPRLQLEQPSIARIWTLATLAGADAQQGGAERAERYAREAMAEVKAAGAETATEFAGIPLALGEALLLRGQLEEARLHIDRGIENEARRPGSVGHALALIWDARLALAEDDWRRAGSSTRRAREIVDRYRDLGALEGHLAQVESALEAPADTRLLDTPLTDAERRVLRLLDSDLTFRQIAAELDISLDTVRSHARRAYRRLGEHSRGGAVAAARERGLLEGD
jgi:LuxR family transcriptional regulator, maltose regulon positive regulatory protein